MKNRWSLFLCASTLVLLQTSATLVFGQTSETYTFATLDVPLPDGQLGFTHLSDINDEGQIAGGFTSEGRFGLLLNFNKKKFRSTKIRCNRKVVFTAPQSINSHGEIAGFADVIVETIRSPEPPHKIFITEIKGFFRDRKGKCTILDFPGAILTEASGVNDSGQVVGDYRDATTGIFHGFLWDAGQFFTIDVPFSEASSTAASGINNIGQIVGHYFDENVGHDRGFLYNDGIFTSFDFPDAVVTIPFDINDNGQIVGLFVGSTGSDASSFILDDGTFTTLDVPFSGVLFTQLRGINNQGQIVGRYVRSNPDDPVNPFPSHGFIASPNVDSPLVASLTAGRTFDSKKTNAVPQIAIDESQNLTTKREAHSQLCFFDSTTPAAFAFALSEAGLCPTGMTMPTENP